MSRDEEQILDEFLRMQRRMDRLFNDMMPTMRWLTAGQRRAWQPPTDVFETDDSVIVRVEVAGVSEEDFAISLSNRSLRISGVRRDVVNKRAYQQLEIPYGHFCTEVFLPYVVAYDEISATYENGFLTVVLPKVQRRRVPVIDKDTHRQAE